MNGQRTALSVVLRSGIVEALGPTPSSTGLVRHRVVVVEGIVDCPANIPTATSAHDLEIDLEAVIRTSSNPWKPILQRS